jgi:hypothetical protein
MLVATRDHEPHAHVAHPGTAAPRSLASRFTSGVQLLGSLVGIPLALIGGYSTYHVTFSPEGKCQSLRAGIVSMLDKKADPTTLRLLIQRDVATFEHDCGAVDADAAAAFKHLLATESAPAVARRVAPPPKIEKAAEATVPQPPVKVEKVEKHEPVKREAVRHETPAKELAAKDVAVKDTPAKEMPAKEMPAKEAPAKEAPAKQTVVKLEAPKQQLGTPPHPLVAPPPAAETAMPLQAGKPPEEARPAETAAVQPETTSVDANWVASVRDALRQSASSQPAAETAADVAAPSLGAPINIAPEPQVASGADRTGLFAPPGDVGPDGSRPQAPRPPASIPDANN